MAYLFSSRDVYSPVNNNFERFLIMASWNIHGSEAIYETDTYTCRVEYNSHIDCLEVNEDHSNSKFE